MASLEHGKSGDTVLEQVNPKSPEPAALERTLEALEGDDRIGHAATGVGTAAGVVAGASAAGAVAGAVGATTLLGSSTLATVLGGVFVTATPIGWVIGCAAVGGAAAYGVARLIRGSGKSDRIREEMRDRIRNKLRTLKEANGDVRELELEKRISAAVARGMLDDEAAARIRESVASGRLDATTAIDRLDRLLEAPSP